MAVDANLAELHRHCVAVEGRCSEATDRMVQAAFQVFGEANRPADRDTLRPIVKRASYVESLKALHAQRGVPPPIVKPYVGELWIVLAISGTSLITMATTETLKQLGLNEDGAFEVALANVMQTKAPVLERAMPMRGTRFELLGEDDYEPSRLLLHSQWAEVAKVRGGNLIVSVPASNAVIFGQARSTDDVRAFRDIALWVTRTAPQALSAQVFRWRPEGWELVNDPGEPQASAPPRPDSVKAR